MTSTTEPTYAVIWTCVVDYGDGEPAASLHASLEGALAGLRKRYDPSGEFAHERSSEVLLFISIDRDLHIQVYPSRVNLAKFQPIDDDGWKAMENWEAEMDKP